MSGSKILRRIAEDFDWQEYVETHFDCKVGTGKNGKEYRVICPSCQNKKQKCYVNPERRLFNCLAAETSVLTWDGYHPICELAGQEAKILTTGGVWVTAPFKSFGQQELYELELSRNGVRKTIRTTAGHRWFISHGVDRERTTSTLRRGSRLLSVKGDRYVSIPSPWGIAHGFTFGDGNVNYQKAQGCDANLWGDKDSNIKKYFPLSTSYDVVSAGGVAGTRFVGLPLFFKEFPNLDESPSYLYGWLAGYFAADGCVSDTGHVSISSASSENMEFVRKLCIRLGIFTFGIRMQMRLGYGDVETPLYHLSFARSSFNEEFFLIDEHKRRWLAHANVKERRGWTVVNVRPLGVTEEVFCATVPDTHAFVLEDNILTGNCYNCDFHTGPNDVYDFVAETEGISRGKAILRLLNEYEPTTPDDNIFLETLHHLWVKKPDELEPVEIRAITGLPQQARKLTPDDPDGVLFLRYLVEERGLTEREVVQMQTHYIPDKSVPVYNAHRFIGDIGQRVLWPIYGGDNELVSWQAREVPPTFLGEPDRKESDQKYYFCPDSDAAKTFWPYVPPYDDHVVLVEGILDCVAVRRLGAPWSAYACFTKHLSEDQIKVLKKWGVKRVTLFWDKRDAKDAMIRTAEHLVMRNMEPYVCDLRDWPTEVDPGKCLKLPDGDAMLRETLSKRISVEDIGYSIWINSF